MTDYFLEKWIRNQKLKDKEHKELEEKWQKEEQEKIEKTKKEQKEHSERERKLSLDFQKEQLLEQKPETYIRHSERINKEATTDLHSWDWRVLEKYVPKEFVPLVQMCFHFQEKVEWHSSKSIEVIDSDVQEVIILAYHILTEFLGATSPFLDPKNKQILNDDIFTQLSRFVTKNMVMKDLTKEYMAISEARSDKTYYLFLIAPLVSFVNTRVYQVITKIVEEKFMKPFPEYFAKETMAKAGIFSNIQQQREEIIAEEKESIAVRMQDLKQREKEVARKEKELRKKEKELSGKEPQKESETEYQEDENLEEENGDEEQGASPFIN